MPRKKADGLYDRFRGRLMIPIKESGRIVGFGGRLLEDGSSLFGLLVVLAMIAYTLRGGGPQAVVPRPLNQRERQLWVLSYALAAVVFASGFDLLGGGFHANSVGAQVNIAAVAVLRGLFLSLVIVSLVLMGRLRDR